MSNGQQPPVNPGQPNHPTIDEQLRLRLQRLALEQQAINNQPNPNNQIANDHGALHGNNQRRGNASQANGSTGSIHSARSVPAGNRGSRRNSNRSVPNGQPTPAASVVGDAGAGGPQRQPEPVQPGNGQRGVRQPAPQGGVGVRGNQAPGPLAIPHVECGFYCFPGGTIKCHTEVQRHNVPIRHPVTGGLVAYRAANNITTRVVSCRQERRPGLRWSERGDFTGIPRQDISLFAVPDDFYIIPIRNRYLMLHLEPCDHRMGELAIERYELGRLVFRRAGQRPAPVPAGNNNAQPVQNAPGQPLPPILRPLAPPPPASVATSTTVPHGAGALPPLNAAGRAHMRANGVPPPYRVEAQPVNPWVLRFLEQMADPGGNGGPPNNPPGGNGGGSGGSSGSSSSSDDDGASSAGGSTGSVSSANTNRLPRPNIDPNFVTVFDNDYVRRQYNDIKLMLLAINPTISIRLQVQFIDLYHQLRLYAFAAERDNSLLMKMKLESNRYMRNHNVRGIPQQLITDGICMCITAAMAETTNDDVAQQVFHTQAARMAAAGNPLACVMKSSWRAYLGYAEHPTPGFRQGLVERFVRAAEESRRLDATVLLARMTLTTTGALALTSVVLYRWHPFLRRQSWRLFRLPYTVVACIMNAYRYITDTWSKLPTQISVTFDSAPTSFAEP